MIFKHLTKLLAIAGGLVLLSGSFSAAYAETYKGGVQQEDVNKIPTPTLNRNDLQSGGDPFQGSAGDNQVDMLQLPPGSMDVEKLRAPAPPKKPYKANIEDQGQGDFRGQQMMPTMEQPPNNPPPQRQPPMQSSAQQQQQSNDPDGSAAMQLLWDAWHKRVAETIYVRFNSLAQMAFKHSQPLACQVSYMVARDGRVGNVQLLQKSNNPIFNTMLLGVINSMNGNPVLEYPPNSRRQFVEKTGTFTWNYGQNGFKFTTGDKETIPGQGQGQQQMRPMQQQLQQPMQQMQQPMQQQMQRPMQMMQQMFGR